ncbi:hypothetical protein F0Z19_1141 [Vibrio cyclitrophicus]|nr:hypothetical protein F0Z19_1141 [Vibrio cyclitrophicus]
MRKQHQFKQLFYQFFSKSAASLILLVNMRLLRALPVTPTS